MNPITRYCLISLFVVIIVVSALLPFASGDPDGLEKVAQTLGFDDREQERSAYAPMQDYDAIGDGSYMSAFIAGIGGTLATLGLGFGTGYLLKK